MLRHHSSVVRTTQSRGETAGRHQSLLRRCDLTPFAKQMPITKWLRHVATSHRYCVGGRSRMKKLNACTKQRSEFATVLTPGASSRCEQRPDPTLLMTWTLSSWQVGHNTYCTPGKGACFVVKGKPIPKTKLKNPQGSATGLRYLHLGFFYLCVLGLTDNCNLSKIRTFKECVPVPNYLPNRHVFYFYEISERTAGSSFCDLGEIWTNTGKPKLG